MKHINEQENWEEEGGSPLTKYMLNAYEINGKFFYLLNLSLVW